MTDKTITSKRQLPENYTVIPLAELLPGEKGLTRDTVCVLHFFVKDAEGRRARYWLLRTDIKADDVRRHRHTATVMKLMSYFTREKAHYELCETPADIIDFLREQERSRNNSHIGDEQTDIETYINELIGYAMTHKTADVHITRFEGHADVEMRINRRLQHISQITTKRADELVNCLYATKSVNKQGDINLRMPQDADVTLNINNDVIRLRYSHAPIHPNGWHCTLRLLSGVDLEVGDFKESLVQLGYFPSQAEAMFRIFKRRYGAFLIAGETGSGKSTTLKITLSNWYNYKEGTINILTAEDPPEYVIHGAKQTPVNKSGKGLPEGHDPFMSVFRSMMRRDGDILMPGEIREASSVNAFTEATLSGHKVVASIHASSAMGIIPRLYNIGTKCRENPVDRNTLSNPNFLSGFAYQQLVPVTCKHCCLTLPEGLKKGYIEQDCYERLCAMVDKSLHAGIRVRNHKGCDKCNHSGLKGVMTCAEVAEVDSSIREYVGNSKDFEADRYWRGLATRLEPQGWADARKNKQGICIMDVAITRVVMGELDPMEAESACDILASPRPEKYRAPVVELHQHKRQAEQPFTAEDPDLLEQKVLEATPVTQLVEPAPVAEEVISTDESEQAVDIEPESLVDQAEPEAQTADDLVSIDSDEVDAIAADLPETVVAVDDEPEAESFEKTPVAAEEPISEEPQDVEILQEPETAIAVEPESEEPEQEVEAVEETDTPAAVEPEVVGDSNGDVDDLSESAEVDTDTPAEEVESHPVPEQDVAVVEQAADAATESAEEPEEDIEPAAHLSYLNQLVEDCYGLDEDDFQLEEDATENLAHSTESDNTPEPVGETGGEPQKQAGSLLAAGYDYSAQVSYGQSWSISWSGAAPKPAATVPPATKPSEDLLKALDSIDGIEQVVQE